MKRLSNPSPDYAITILIRTSTTRIVESVQRLLAQVGEHDRGTDQDQLRRCLGMRRIQRDDQPDSRADLQTGSKEQIMNAIKQVQEALKEGFSFGTCAYGDKLEIVDSFYYGGEEKREAMVAEWSAGGSYHTYFKDELGVDLKVESSFCEMVATGRYKKISDAGVVGIVVSVNYIHM